MEIWYVMVRWYGMVGLEQKEGVDQPKEVVTPSAALWMTMNVHMCDEMHEGGKICILSIFGVK